MSEENRALALALAVMLGILIFLYSVRISPAHDHNRPELNSWFKDLKSDSGAWCCDGADATRLDDVDWETKEGHYRVRINGAWVDVPDGAIINKPNLDGQTMVWPMYGPNGSVGVRCFIVGAGG